MPRISKKILSVRNIKVRVGDREILKGVDLDIKPGRISALMGPNGSGKSTLAQVLMGNPSYHDVAGKVMWQGKNILNLPPHERARAGLFLAFQYPRELPGVNMYEFLFSAYQACAGKKARQEEFDQRLSAALEDLKLPDSFLDRSVNDGFSGGEKKKCEILQLKVMRPSIAVLDETDSGLDIDALKLIARAVRAMIPNTGFLIITHYQRLLNHIRPDEVSVMLKGKIVKRGGFELVKKLEGKGYGWLKKK